MKFLFLSFFLSFLSNAHNGHEHFKNFPISDSFLKLYKERARFPGTNAVFNKFFRSSFFEILSIGNSKRPPQTLNKVLSPFFKSSKELVCRGLLSELPLTKVEKIIFSKNNLNEKHFKSLFSLNQYPHLKLSKKENQTFYIFNESVRSFVFDRLSIEAIAFLFKDTIKEIFEKTKSTKSFETLEFTIQKKYLKKPELLNSFFEILKTDLPEELVPQKIFFYFSFPRKILPYKRRLDNFFGEYESFLKKAERYSHKSLKFGIDLSGSISEGKSSLRFQFKELRFMRTNLLSIFNYCLEKNLPLRIHAFEGDNDSLFYQRVLYQGIKEFTPSNPGKVDLIFGHGAFLTENFFQKKILPYAHKFSLSIDFNLLSNQTLQKKPTLKKNSLNYLFFKNYNSKLPKNSSRYVKLRLGSDGLGILGLPGSTIEHQELLLEELIGKL